MNLKPCSIVVAVDEERVRAQGREGKGAGRVEGECEDSGLIISSLGDASFKRSRTKRCKKSEKIRTSAGRVEEIRIAVFQ